MYFHRYVWAHLYADFNVRKQLMQRMRGRGTLGGALHTLRYLLLIMLKERSSADAHAIIIQTMDYRKSSLKCFMNFKRILKNFVKISRYFEIFLDIEFS